LLQDAQRGRFEIVLAEALDRVSRYQADVATLFTHLRFAGVQIVTLAEGEISELHVGLKGTMNALFLKDLAAKTHRGLRGRVKLRQAALAKQFGSTIEGVRKARAERLDRLCRPAFLLSGLLTSGCCGGKYGIIVNDRYGCLGHFGKGHPNIAEHYRAKVIRLAETLAEPGQRGNPGKTSAH
jgi:hypothetical protein